METIELFSSRVCPFAHRSRLALMEKALPFELVEIDLRNKPDWYKEINPTGAVPALRQGNFLLRESLIINEYVEELSHFPPLLPASAQNRAMARLWIDFAGTRFVPAYYRMLKARNAEDRNAAGNELLAVLSILDKELDNRRSEGRYWFGRNVGLTDIAIYPWFERWPVLEHYRDFSIPGEMKSLLNWIEAMKEREMVKQGGQPAAFYIEAYRNLAGGNT